MKYNVTRRFVADLILSIPVFRSPAIAKPSAESLDFRSSSESDYNIQLQRAGLALLLRQELVANLLVESAFLSHQSESQA